MGSFSMLFALILGFGHAFEADHLVAVSNIVTRRNNVLLAIKDGLYWGLGHTSIILVASLVFMLGKFILNENAFKYFEAMVGLMLVVLGIFRLFKIIKNYKIELQHEAHNHEHSHSLAYGIGAIHGLAGSGAILLTVLTQIKNNITGFTYLLLFGIGSILGMMLAAGIFSLPFSSKINQNKWVGVGLSVLSSVLCLGLGIMIFYKNIAL